MTQPFLALPKDFRNLLLQLPSATEEEAARITVLIQEYLKGDSLRRDDPDWGLRASKLTERAVARDKAEEQWETRGQSWIDDIVHDAQGKLPNADQVDRLKAKGAKVFQEARKVVKGHRATKQMQLDQILKLGPKEEIHVTGNWMMVGGENDMHPEIRPDVIKIMHRTFVLEPGVHTVPSVVAEAYRNMQAGRAEAGAREAILKGPGAGRLYDAGEIEDHWDAIDSKYGTERVRFQGG